MGEHETLTDAAGRQPRAVWATAERIERLRRAHVEADPTARGIAARARALLEAGADDPTKPIDIGAALIVAWIDGEAARLREAMEQAIARAEEPERADLVLARWTMEAALLLDGCGEAVADHDRRRLVGAIIRLLDRQLDVPSHRGNPHAVGNNHWAVTHSSMLAAAMVCHGRATLTSDAALDLAERVHWARQRVSAYLALVGDAGFGHEGIGYLMYAMSYLLPVVVGGKRFDAVDLCERCPALRRLAASLFITAIAKPPRESSSESLCASKLAWNDDGPGWPELCTAILAIHLAPADQTAALRWMFDHLNGIAGSSRFGDRDSGLTFTALFYPFDTPAASPDVAASPLPRDRFDARQGMSLFRNRYRDGDDAVIGLYTKATFGGGHRQDDAGSVRLSALGQDWIIGGGQARPDRRFQSVVCPADGSTGTGQTGAVLWHEAREGGGGGIAACDLRKVSGAYHERWVSAAFDRIPGADIAVAMLDLVDDHLGRPWAWRMTFAPELNYQADEDGGGFVLTGMTNARMHVRFCGAAPDRLELEHTPASQRSFQSAPQPTIYPPRPFVSARFEPREHLAIYAIMAIRRGSPARIQPRTHLEVAIDEQVWTQPFGCAIGAWFDLDQAGGTCRFPMGRRWHLRRQP